MKRTLDMLLLVALAVTIYLVGAKLGQQRAIDDRQQAIESHYDYERMVCE